MRAAQPGRGHRGVHRRLHHPQHPAQGPLDAQAGRNLTVRLYDTARGEVVAFEPGPLVTMYSCGITPYDAAHLGHAAVYLYFDMLQRRLRDAGHDTRCVRNVTDVDDDILRKARELGVHYLDLAAEEMARFDAEMGLLEPAARLLRAAGDVGHPRDPLPHRCRARGRPRLRIGRVRLLQRGLLRGVRAAQRLRATPHVGTGGRTRRPSRRSQQTRPARLRPLAALPARRAGLGVALGSGAAGLAHRVFGPGAA